MHPAARRWRRSLLWLGLLGSAAALGGCKDRACFQWGEAEGACPSQNEARSFFPGLDCLNFSDENQFAVETVDSEGDFEGDVCCYDVTYVENADDACFQEF